ncbi:MAG: J domain-containing protein, partial [Pseudomonadota bacterium]
DFSSRDYDRIRAARRRGGGGRARDAGSTTMARDCAVEGCTESGDYKAPQGRGKEGQFHYFCLDHVREYNKRYNYFDGMSDDDVIAYQRDAITGHRPTKPIGVRGPGERAKASWNGHYDDPFGLFGGAGGPDVAPEPERRKPKGPERHALEVMGLEDTASREAIKARYKTLVKRHHPDANQGDRSSEDRLRNVINAYNVLRRAGYC